MSFIAIDAKADIQGNKKGKLTPEQHAQLNAWSLSKETGIFDCLGRCEYDNSLSVLVPKDNIATVVFKKGYFLICGRLVECEVGTSVEINTNSMPNGKIVARFDLKSIKEGEFSVFTKTGDLEQSDLLQNPLDSYEFELYSYTFNGSSVVLTRNPNTVYIQSVKKSLQDIEDGVERTLEDFDTRLDDFDKKITNMGFKKGTVSLSVDGTVPNNDSECTKMGCWIIVKIIGFDGGYINNENAKKVGTITGIALSGDITLKEWMATQQYLNDTSWKIVLKKNGDLIVSKTNSGNINVFAVPYIYQVFTENANYQPPTNVV